MKRYFLEVRQRLGVDAKGTEAQLDELRQAVARRCPAFNRIRDAGVRVEVAAARLSAGRVREGAGGRRCGIRSAGRSGAARLRPAGREEGG